jgi:hypothetical protein
MSRISIGATMGPVQGGGDYYALPADRSTLWQPGVTYNGGIPARTTIYTTLSPSGGDDTAAIQNACNGCPANQVVKLNAGTFLISGSGIEMNTSNITLRGSGVGSTILQKTDRATSAFPIIILGRRWCDDKMTNSVDLSVDGVKGEYSVTLASAPSPVPYVGQIVYLDQYTNSSKTMWGYKPEAAEPDFSMDPDHPARYWFHRWNRPISQVCQVAAVSGDHRTITFDAPLHIDFPTADVSQLSIYYAGGSVITETKWSGIEDLTFTLGGAGNVGITLASYCWLKNVECSHWNGAPNVSVGAAFRCEVRDSLLWQADQPSPGGAGYCIAVEYGSADCLVENCIMWSCNKVQVMRASGGGNVWGYNYMQDGLIDYMHNFVESGMNASHMTTPHYELFEGNESFGIDGDFTWGNSIYITFFRNNATGIRRNEGSSFSDGDGTFSGLTDEYNRKAAGMGEKHWWYSFVGNILGAPGMAVVNPPQSSMIYEWTGTEGDAVFPMWKLCQIPSEVGGGQDAVALSRTLRDGNYDYLTTSQRWHGIGGDPGDGTPATLPDSLYLDSKPAFFGSETWPWVEPGGSTKLYTLPAKARFDALKE